MTWQGMSKTTGLMIGEMDHIRQSVADILTTPIGSRVMRRDYGSLIFELVDRPANEENRLLLMAASVQAIMLWEPRISLTSVDVSMDKDGKVLVSFDAERIDGGQPIYIDNLQVR